jgi:hypothetical protein
MAQDKLEVTLRRNIGVIREREADDKNQSISEQVVSDAMPSFAGSMNFIYVHVVIVAVWIFRNSEWNRFFPKWDPSFVLLAAAASVEASSFRPSFSSAKRAEPNSIFRSIYSEHELTKAITLLIKIADKLDIGTSGDADVEAFQEEVDTGELLSELEEPEPP